MLQLGEVPRIEFLRRVQEAVLYIYSGPAVSPQCLESWSRNSAFTERPVKGGQLFVNGRVESSAWKTRDQQEENGWLDVDICDLAVAHAAYFLVTGKDLFDRDLVRARDGTLHFVEKRGLHQTESGEGPACNVAASAKLPIGK